MCVDTKCRRRCVRGRFCVSETAITVHSWRATSLGTPQARPQTCGTAVVIAPVPCMFGCTCEVLMTFDIGEFHEKVTGPVTFSFRGMILTIAVDKTINIFRRFDILLSPCTSLRKK